MDDTTPPPPPPLGPAGPAVAGERATRVRQVVYEFLARRQRGEDVPPERVQSDHADLMPELAEALAAGLRSYRRVFDARRAWASPPDAEGPPAASAFPVIRGYRFRREVSRGGQGTVFEAVFEPTGRVVAVKVLTSVSRTAVARFEREAQALASVAHPGVVAILDRGLTQSGSYYIAVEYVAGSDLDEWVAARPKGEAGRREVVALFAKVAAALGAAHAKRIVHRDVKPSNVRVDALGNSRVIDFGLAHVADPDRQDRHLTVTRDIVGSVHWLSPEQAAGRTHAIGPASDVYALGVALYHALTGRFPYPVDGPLHDVTRGICEAAPADPRSGAVPRLGPVDATLAAVLLKCLAKRPEDRYPSGDALAAALAAYLAGTLTPPRRPGRPWARRASIAMAAVVLAGVAAGRTWYSRAAPELPQPITFPDYTNTIGMEFVQIPAGMFSMGSPRDESGRRDNEQPHPVRITRPILFGRTEVTRSQYRRVTGSLPPGVPEEPRDVPVDNVTWDEAEAFCRKLSELDGRNYRLPTEAEWEFACRAGTMGAHAVDERRLGDVAWYSANSGGTLHPVATRAPNRWRLFDLHGNAAELTADTYESHLGGRELADPFHRSENASHVVRGGWANDPAEDCRSASRVSLPTFSRRPGIGFRVAIGPDPTPAE